MQNQAERIIVKKDYSPSENPHTGYVKAVGFLQEDNTYREATQSDFPNKGQIFVYSRFDEINTRYAFNDLFFLSECYPSTNFRFDVANSAKFSITGDRAEDPKRHQLCPIFDREFDPLTSFTLVVDYIPHTYVFLRSPSTNYIYGPFSPLVEEKADDDYYNITLKAVVHSELKLDYNFDKCIFRFNDASDSIITVDNTSYIYDTIQLLEDHPSIINNIIYYGSNEDLLEWGRKNIGQVAGVEERAIKELFKSINEIPLNHELDNIKLEKLRHLIKGTETWLVSGLPKFIHNYLSTTNEGLNYLNDFLERNKNSIVEKYDPAIKSKENEIKELDLRGCFDFTYQVF